MRKEDIVAAALEMVDTPFHAQQSVKGVGTDCIGVAKHVARRVNFEFEDNVTYSMQPTGELQPILEALFVRVRGDIQAGDIVLMKWDDCEPHHVAVYIGNGRIVHAYSRAEKVVNQSFGNYWKKKTVAFYRFPGVE